MFNVRQTVLDKLGETTDVCDENGEVLYHLNAGLILQQNVTADELKNLKKLHLEKNKVFNEMRNTDDSAKLIEYAKEVTRIEFDMQSNWHFPIDETYHEWYKVPKCKCPKMDNAERRGTQYQIRVQDCPIHGFDLT